MTGRGGEEILFSRQEIALRVEEVARAIVSGPRQPDCAAPVLVGGFVFAADLLRALSREGLDLPIDFLWLRSYGDRETPGEVMVRKPPTELVRNRTVLLIDGVLDSGATLAKARELVMGMGAAAIISAVAVRKRNPDPAIVVDHSCFDAGADFLFGYGMDRAGQGRGLPDIRIARKSA